MTCHITGSVVIPDGSSAANRKITFRKEDFTVTTDGGLAVVPEYITVYTDSSGNVSFDLMPGTYSGFYVSAPDGRLPFRFNVPSDVTAANFADLIVTSSVTADQGLIDLVNRAYEVIQITDAVRTFNTRSEFVTWASGFNPTVGSAVTANGYAYRYIGSGTAIADLPGWVPVGDATPSHWGATKGSTLVDDSTRVSAAMVWAASNTGRLVFDGLYRVDGVNGQSNLVCDGLDGTGGIVSLAVVSWSGLVLNGQHVINAVGLTNFAFVGMVFDNSVNTRFASGLRTISMYGCSYYEVRNCRFATGGAATASVNCHHYRIDGNDTLIQTLYQVGGIPTVQNDGVYDQWWGSHDFVISNNTITAGNASAKFPILVTGTDTASTAATPCYRFQILNNQVMGFQASGIYVQGRHGGCEDFLVQGNHIDGQGASTSHGLIVAAGLRGRVLGNSIRNTARNGIRLHKEGPSYEIGIHSNENIVVADNVIEGANQIGIANNEGAAILIRDEFRGVTVTGNIIAGSTHAYPVFVGGDSASETNCHVGQNTYTAGTVGGITFGSVPDSTTGAWGADDGSYRIWADGNLRLTLDSTAALWGVPTLLPSGTAAAPAMAYSSATGSGMWHKGAGVLGMSVNGALVATFDAAAFSVAGQTTESVYARIGHGRTGNGNAALALISDATNTLGGSILTRYAGTNGILEVRHKGTGAIQVVGENAATFLLSLNGAEALRVTSSGQLAIGTGGPSAASLVHIESTTKGFLGPRMTTAQRDAIASPPNGLEVYNTTTETLDVRSNGVWESFAFTSDIVDLTSDQSIGGNKTFTGTVNLSNPVSLPTGSVSSPAVAPSSDPTTGLYWPSAGLMAIAMGGVITGSFAQAGWTLRASSTESANFRVGYGRAGDGTSSIGLVSDTTYSAGGATINRYAGANGATEIRHRGTGALQFVTQDSAPVIVTTNNVEAIRVDTSQRVGIGTNGPSCRLDVVGQIRSRPVTVASLPTPASVGAGASATVSDSTVAYAAAAIGSTVAGGGSNNCPVWCNGTNWVIG